MSVTVGELAARLGVPLEGDATVAIHGVAPLDRAGPGELGFLADPKYLPALRDTGASAVILRAEHAAECPAPARLIADDPYLCYARAVRALFPEPPAPPGVHPSAVVGQGCSVPDSVRLGPGVVLGDGVVLGERVRIDAGCYVGDGVCIGADSWLKPRVVIQHDVIIGQRCVIDSGTVIGSDGFGYANDHGTWLKIPQLGTVRIGDDVEIGANTTVDRGALEDTVIGDGVKLDNQIQVAHNVQIGEHTAIAGCTGIAGSAKIGRHCAIGGGVGVVGHLEITDNVVITGMTFVAHPIDRPGSYSSGVPMQETARWRRNYARFRQLDDIARRLARLEKRLPADDEEA